MRPSVLPVPEILHGECPPACNRLLMCSTYALPAICLPTRTQLRVFGRLVQRQEKPPGPEVARPPDVAAFFAVAFFIGGVAEIWHSVAVQVGWCLFDARPSDVCVLSPRAPLCVLLSIRNALCCAA